MLLVVHETSLITNGQEVRLHAVSWDLRSYQANSLPRDITVFVALEQNLGDHWFQNDCEFETVLTRWLITKDTD
jgi:hypothetical protein